jgi:hypothetical protein
MIVAFSSLAVAAMIWSAGSPRNGCGRTVDRQTIVSVKGTSRSFGIRMASDSHSSGSHEMPRRSFLSATSR